MKKYNPFDLIHPEIAARWHQKYGAYLMAYSSTDVIIFCENGRLDCFHPTGDRLARHIISTGQTLYLWNNNPKELLTETEYLVKIGVTQGEDSWKPF